MASFTDKFMAEWQGALILGGVAAVATYIGIPRILSSAAATVGVAGAISDPQLFGSLMVGGTVFVSSVAYNMFMK